MIQATKTNYTTTGYRSQDPSLKVYADLNVAALERKEAKFLRVWYLIRHINLRGRGWVWFDDLKTFCLEHQIMSKDSLRQTLRDGDGTWWVIVDYPDRGRKVCLRGIRRICEHLEIGRVRRTPVMLPLDVFRKIGDFKAHVYSTMFNGNNKPMSRQTIKAISGVSARSQRNYEKRAKVETTQNWARSKLPHRLSRAALGQGEYQRYERGDWYLYKRLPDTRASHYPMARRGMVRRINRLLLSGRDYLIKYAMSKGRSSFWDSYQGRADFFRRYFDKARQILKARNRLDVVYLRQGRRRDVMIWQPVYIE